MPIELAIAFSLFALVVVGTLAFIVARLRRENYPENLSPHAQQLARQAGFPSCFDRLLARHMTKREIFGWAIFTLIVIVAVTFTGGRH